MGCSEGNDATACLRFLVSLHSASWISCSVGQVRDSPPRGAASPNVSKALQILDAIVTDDRAAVESPHGPKNNNTHLKPPRPRHVRRTSRRLNLAPHDGPVRRRVDLGERVLAHLEGRDLARQAVDPESHERLRLEARRTRRSRSILHSSPGASVFSRGRSFGAGLAIFHRPQEPMGPDHGHERVRSGERNFITPFRKSSAVVRGDVHCTRAQETSSGTVST